MVTKSTFSLSFYLRNDKANKDKTAPVYMRVTVNGKRAEIAINRRFDINRWENGQPSGNKPDSRQLKEYMLSLRSRVYKIQQDFADRNELPTADQIKNRFQGRDRISKSIFEVFDFHNQQIQTGTIPPANISKSI
ncbi:MAG: Arm DNA-binding domain-containing protein [Bacteroidia bacterium]|nr:Arm DNA-binding domain-containing protein [Bacteroidia bacterium]